MISIFHRLAARLIEHAGRIMPPSRRQWAQAMAIELDHIPGGLAALAFALGCAQAGYTQKIVAMNLFAKIIRWTLAAMAAAWAGSLVVLISFTAILKSVPGAIAADPGSHGETVNTLRLIQIYPVWELVLIALITVLLIAGAVQLVRRRGMALTLIAFGVTAATVLRLIDLRLTGYKGISSDAPMGFFVELLIPLLCLGPVWWLSRQAPDLKVCT